MLPTEFRFIRFVVGYELINRFSVSNSYEFPDFDKIILNMTVFDQDSFVSSFYPRSALFLEFLSGFKSFVSSFKKSLKGKKTYKVSFSTQVTLRKRYLYSFLYLLLLFIFSSADKKFLKFNKKVSLINRNYYFSIRDSSVLPGMLEYFFKWPYPVSFYLLLDKRFSLDRLFIFSSLFGFRF